MNARRLRLRFRRATGRGHDVRPRRPSGAPRLVKELFGRDYPELDDALAEKIYPGSTSVADAKAKIARASRRRMSMTRRAIDEAFVGVPR